MQPEGVKGATADFVCFHCPLVASAEAKPSATIKDCCFFRQPALIFLPIWSLPYFQRAKKTNEVRDRPLDSFGGRLPCRLNCIGRLFSYWQGRFAACTFVDFSFGMVARETVGALPQTPQGAPPLDPARGRRKGTKSPLDPFWLPGLGALPYFFFSFAFFS